MIHHDFSMQCVCTLVLQALRCYNLALWRPIDGALLPAGHGGLPTILAHLGSQGTWPWPLTRQVSALMGARDMTITLRLDRGHIPHDKRGASGPIRCPGVRAPGRREGKSGRLRLESVDDMAGIRTRRDQRFAALRILVIPSNHDPDLSQGDIAAKSVEVITEPQLLALDRPRPGALRIPYKSQETMGEHISPLSGSLEDGRWVMIGRGDWDEGVRAPNPYEPGVYMPLTRKDLAAYKPGKVLLGHAHLSLDLELGSLPRVPLPRGHHQNRTAAVPSD